MIRSYAKYVIIIVIYFSKCAEVELLMSIIKWKTTKFIGKKTLSTIAASLMP